MNLSFPSFSRPFGPVPGAESTAKVKKREKPSMRHRHEGRILFHISGRKIVPERASSPLPCAVWKGVRYLCVRFRAAGQAARACEDTGVVLAPAPADPHCVPVRLLAPGVPAVPSVRGPPLGCAASLQSFRTRLPKYPNQ